jgi:hypothetical protein
MVTDGGRPPPEERPDACGRGPYRYGPGYGLRPAGRAARRLTKGAWIRAGVAPVAAITLAYSVGSS